MIDRKIIVQDWDLTIYPSWFQTNPLPPPLTLKTPIQILCPIPPQSEYVLFYSDSSPSYNRFKCPGTAGLAVVVPTGDVYTLKTTLVAGTPFMSEGRALLAGVVYAVEHGFLRCIFFSDNKDLISALNGDSTVREEYQELIREIRSWAALLEKKLFIHTPRESVGIELCDEIAYFYKQKFLKRQLKFGPGGECHFYGSTDSVIHANEKITKLTEKLRLCWPTYKISAFSESEVKNADKVPLVRKLSPMREETQIIIE